MQRLRERRRLAQGAAARAAPAAPAHAPDARAKPRWRPAGGEGEWGVAPVRVSPTRTDAVFECAACDGVPAVLTARDCGSALALLAAAGGGRGAGGQTGAGAGAAPAAAVATVRGRTLIQPRAAACLGGIVAS